MRLYYEIVRDKVRRKAKKNRVGCRLHDKWYIWETREGVSEEFFSFFFSVFLWHRLSIFEQPLSPALDASRHLGSTLLGGRHGCAGTQGPWPAWAKPGVRAHHSALRRCRHSHTNTTWVAYSFWRFYFILFFKLSVAFFFFFFPLSNFPLLQTEYWHGQQFKLPALPVPPVLHL